MSVISVEIQLSAASFSDTLSAMRFPSKLKCTGKKQRNYLLTLLIAVATTAPPETVTVEARVNFKLEWQIDKI